MRSFPEYPVVAVGAVVFQEDSVLLVKRAQEPLQGEWSLPGGTVELGESLEAAVARETAEETGLTVDVGPVVAVLDRVEVQPGGRVEFHYVIVDYLCRLRTGTLVKGDDADDVCFAAIRELDEFRLTDNARQVIERAARMQDTPGPAPSAEGPHPWS